MRASAALLTLIAAAHFGTHAGELDPTLVRPSPGGVAENLGVYSDRTLVVGIEIDRDQAHLLSYTVKPRTYTRAVQLVPPRIHNEERAVQIEVVLLGADGSRHTRRVDAGPICLDHERSMQPHIAGDTIRMHQDAILVELPELAEHDRIEVAYYERERGTARRRAIGTSRLDRNRFTPAAGPLTYADLAFADSGVGAPQPPTPTAADVLWPEAFDDPDIYQVFGDATEGNRRINVVIAPDGYRYQDKTLMEIHANQLVDYFRSKTPYAEHDPFLNYILVYTYSLQAGTDQCDCSVITNTALGTRFPEQNPQCGHSDNRCLSYGNGCDTNGVANLVAAELRAPYQDETIVMVNTPRYGGCGGTRATYSAGNASALELAAHEFAHSLAGLADEYAYNAGCGSSAGEINTSLDANLGAWPEWLPDLGAPREGAQYWQQCIYRPFTDCEMRNLFVPFCAVCNQHWSLVTFGHFRVSPTAPIESQSPSYFTTAWIGVPTDFEIATRLSAGNVQNSITWRLLAPGDLLPFVVAGDTTSHTQLFDEIGTYTLTAEVVADTNFVKPSRNGANVDVATWQVTTEVLAPPQEVSPPGSTVPLHFVDPATLIWEDASSSGAFAYNVYRGALSNLSAGSYGACLQQALEDPSTTDPGIPPTTDGWAYLVAGVNPVGEGPLGQTSGGLPRGSDEPCE